MMAEAMEFPETFDEFVDSYGFVDTKEVYTNGSHLIPVFRVKQWLEHISEKTQMIDKSNFDTEQYKTDLQSAYDCGYNKALSENKGEWISTEDRPDGFCSKCDHDIDEASTPYCPYCGAKMTWLGAIREPYKAESEDK